MTTFVDSVVKFPYKRSLGPVIGEFMTALTQMRLVGIRANGRVLVPPLEWDPATGEELAHDFVDVGPVGTVRSWTWVASPSEQHPLKHPFAFALIELEGADTGFFHAVDAGDADRMSVGMQVAPRWRAARKGHITDIEAFVPGDCPVIPQDDAGPASEPVTMMEYNASITYSTPVTANQIRAGAAEREGRILGLRCSECGRLYSNGKAFCPIDAVELTEADEVDLPQTGTVTNYTIITPVQYPGQTETEPFARVHVLLDGGDVLLAYQALVGAPNDAVRVGLRVSAVWTTGEGTSSLDGWTPNGEPDVDDPSLVNRIS